MRENVLVVHVDFCRDATLINLVKDNKAVGQIKQAILIFKCLACIMSATA